MFTLWVQIADVAAVTIMFPGALFAMAGGAIFGVPLGCALVWLGTAIGQTLAFIVGRCASSSTPRCSIYTESNAEHCRQAKLE